MTNASEYQTYHTVCFCQFCVVTPLVGLFGLCGNTLCITVLHRCQVFRKTMRLLLLCLAYADNGLVLSLSSLLFSEGLGCYSQLGGVSWAESTWESLRHFYQVVYPFITLFACSAYLLITSVSVDRYICICYPIRAPKYSTVRHVRFVLVAIACLAVAMSVLSVFDKTETSYWNPLPDNGTFADYDATFQNLGAYSYFHTMSVAIPLFVSVAVSAVMNALVMRKVNQSPKSATAGRSVDRPTRMLVVVVTVLAVCTVPTTVYRIVWPLGTRRTTIIMYLRMTSAMTLLVNSSVNFVIYLVLGQKFRASVVGMLRGERGLG